MQKYYVSLPTAQAHHSIHPTGGVFGMAQKVHPKYELPLFFICVKTNVGYSIIADFIVQFETSVH